MVSAKLSVGGTSLRYTFRLDLPQLIIRHGDGTDAALKVVCPYTVRWLYIEFPHVSVRTMQR